MSFESTANTIRDRFVTQFHAARSEPITFQNWGQFYQKDGSIETTKPNGSAWVRLSIQNGDSRQVATVGDKWRHPGVLIVQVFTPVGQGDKEALIIADAVVSVFQGVTVSGIRFRATSINAVGPSDGWYQVNVTTDFEYDT